MDWHVHHCLNKMVCRLLPIVYLVGCAHIEKNVDRNLILIKENNKFSAIQKLLPQQNNFYLQFKSDRSTHKVRYRQRFDLTQSILPIYAAVDSRLITIFYKGEVFTRFSSLNPTLDEKTIQSFQKFLIQIKSRYPKKIEFAFQVANDVDAYSLFNLVKKTQTIKFGYDDDEKEVELFPKVILTNTVVGGNIH